MNEYKICIQFRTRDYMVVFNCIQIENQTINRRSIIGYMFDAFILCLSHFLTLIQSLPNPQL